MKCQICCDFIDAARKGSKEREKLKQYEKRNGMSGPEAKAAYSNAADEFAFNMSFYFLKSLTKSERNSCDSGFMLKYLVAKGLDTGLPPRIMSFLTLSAFRRRVKPKLRRALKEYGGWFYK